MVDQDSILTEEKLTEIAESISQLPLREQPEAIQTAASELLAMLV